MVDLLSPAPTRAGVAIEPDAEVVDALAAPSFLDRWWYAIGAVLVIVGSDYEFRLRDPRNAISGGIDTAIMFELAMYGVAAGLMISRLTRPPRLRRVPTHVVFCCFWAGVMVLSVTYAAYPQYALVRAGQSVVVVAIALSAASSGGRAHFHRFAHAFLVLITVSVGYGVAVPSPPVNALQAGRFSWLAIHPTVSGVLTGLASLLALGYLIAGARDRPGPMWPRPIYAVLAVISVGALLAVHTRGAVLGAAVSIVLLLGLYLGRRGRAVVVLYGVLAILAAVLVATDTVVAYFVRGEDPSTITTLNSRTDIWTLAAHAFEREPVWGYGVGSTRGLFLDELGIGGGHNAVVNVVVEVGIVGLICWLGMLATMVWSVSRISRSGAGEMRLDRALVLSILAFVLVDGMFYEGPGAAANVASAWVIACVGWVWALRRESMGTAAAPAT